MITHCLHCGDELTGYSTSNDEQKYCSERCRCRSKAVRQHLRKSLFIKRTRSDRCCLICGGSIPGGAHGRQILCSIECQAVRRLSYLITRQNKKPSKHCPTCNELVIGSKKYCSPTCRPRKKKKSYGRVRRRLYSHNRYHKHRQQHIEQKRQVRAEKTAVYAAYTALMGNERQPIFTFAGSLPVIRYGKEWYSYVVLPMNGRWTCHSVQYKRERPNPLKVPTDPERRRKIINHYSHWHLYRKYERPNRWRGDPKQESEKRKHREREKTAIRKAFKELELI